MQNLYAIKLVLKLDSYILINVLLINIKLLKYILETIT